VSQTSTPEQESAWLRFPSFYFEIVCRPYTCMYLSVHTVGMDMYISNVRGVHCANNFENHPYLFFPL